MDSISDTWSKSKATFEAKSLPQILSFTADGKLKDNNQTSSEFRELLDQIPSTLLKKYSDNCLTEKFDDGGFALQDIINQIGIRLGFEVVYGLYRGKQNDIGFDGIWTSSEGHSIVLEVKTTDAYRINLDTIATYRQKLINSSRIDKTNSSILIVVGRQDTGDLEAQIRGSQHAWDVRLISTESLMQLLSLKETLNDSRTILQINELLKPKEYTRIDKLIELIFVASKDLQLTGKSEEEFEEIAELEEMDEIISEVASVEKTTRNSPKERITPVRFQEECVMNIEEKLGINLIKQSRSTYTDKNKTIGVVNSISKHYKNKNQPEFYWFSFQPYQKDFLEKIDKAFVAFGCGLPDSIFLIPFTVFEPLIKNLNITERDDKMYWHVKIYNYDNKYILTQIGGEKKGGFEITQYKI